MRSEARIAKIGIVGTGWRADLFAQIVNKLREEFELVGVTARTAESAARGRAMGRHRLRLPG